MNRDRWQQDISSFSGSVVGTKGPNGPPPPIVFYTTREGKGMWSACRSLDDHHVPSNPSHLYGMREDDQCPVHPNGGATGILRRMLQEEAVRRRPRWTPRRRSARWRRSRRPPWSRHPPTPAQFQPSGLPGPRALPVDAWPRSFVFLGRVFLHRSSPTSASAAKTPPRTHKPFEGTQRGAPTCVVQPSSWPCL